MGRKKRSSVHVVSAAILRDETCLVAERGQEMSYSDRWELPGGKVEPGEEPREALRRELREELDVDAFVGRRIAEGEVETGERTFRVEVFEVHVAGGPPRPREHARADWFRAEELDSLEWVEPHLPVVDPVKAHLRRHASTWPLNPADAARRMVDLTSVAMEWAAVPVALSVALSASAYAFMMAGLQTAFAKAR